MTGTIFDDRQELILAIPKGLDKAHYGDIGAEYGGSRTRHTTMDGTAFRAVILR